MFGLAHWRTYLLGAVGCVVAAASIAAWRHPWGFPDRTYRIGIRNRAASPLGTPEGRLDALAFPIVTMGAVGAAFKYDEVAIYRFPLLGVVAAVIVLGFLRPK